MDFQGGIIRKPAQTSGNPLFEGWYADPEGIVFDHECWTYPTWSQPFDEQLFMDAFRHRAPLFRQGRQDSARQDNLRGRFRHEVLVVGAEY